ncbi:MAG: hypothetical protein ACI84D_000816 [Thalassolituus oleivorans]|jgi:hypothetical protein
MENQVPELRQSLHRRITLLLQAILVFALVTGVRRVVRVHVLRGMWSVVGNF